MATQYTPEEIAEIFEAYNNAIKTGTPISEDLARQMQDATKATKGLAKAQEEFGKSLGKSALQLSNSLYKGEKGVGQFGDAVELAANAIQAAILAIPGIGIAAKVATVAMVALAKGVNAAAKQGDALYKTYQDLGRAGATASDGISGVFRNMQNLGYGIEELDKMVQLVSQNSQTLARFSSTAADGTNAFAKGMSEIQRDGQLRLLGKTTEDINSAGAAYIRQSVRAGISQKEVGDKLGSSTKQYILELDRLQRLTGTSADALQKQQDEAMAEDAYNDVMSELKQRALAGDKVAEAQIQKITTTMATMGPEMRKQFVMGIGGDIGAQSKLFMTMPSLLRNTMDETVSTQQTLQEAQRDATNTVNIMGKSARLNAEGYRDTYIGLAETREFATGTKDFKEREKAAAENAKVTDKATQSLTEAQIANMNSRDAMQSFVQLGVAPATSALSSLATTVEDLTSILPGGSKPGKGMNTPGYGAQGTGTRGGSVGSMAAGAVAGAAIGSVVPVVGTGIGAAIGAAAGYLGYGALGGKGEKPEDYLQFGGESGSRESFEKLNPDIKNSLMAAGKQYKDVTGNLLTVNSAFRDTEKQKKLYDEYIARGKTGMPVAPPGSSSHESGMAVDIQQGKSDRQAIAALNAAGLFQTVANDPVHFAKNGGYKFGGIASGPSSGYTTTLHGTEAIVPLPDGKTIPVEIPGFSANFSDQTNLMAQQLDKLDELVRVMQNQVSVSTKILQAAN